MALFSSPPRRLLSRQQWNDLLEKGMQRFGTAVSVTYLSRRNPFKPISRDATLLQVARALSTQVHRVPIVDAEGKCVAIISQSALVHFLQDHRDEIKDDTKQNISGLPIGICKVISVKSDATAWEAFSVLELHAVSGIAIVDREGKLTGNTSARDLKYFVLNRGNLSMDSPIQEYLSLIRQRDIEDVAHPSCCIGVSTTIAHCIGLLAATGYHRVFIVDSASRPVGVLSVTDILRFASADSSNCLPPTVPSTPSTPRGKYRTEGTTPTGVTLPSGVASGSSSGTTTPLGSSIGGRGALFSRTKSDTPIITPSVTL
jgi:CBS domain-containing protein